jgi:hypothetical protein
VFDKSLNLSLKLLEFKSSELEGINVFGDINWLFICKKNGEIELFVGS